MSTKIEVTVIGAGVVGCAVARELAQRGREVVVLEKNPGVTQGENQSSRNSGVIHAGLYYDPQTMPLKARFCAQGNRLLHEFCARYGVPSIQTGKLVVATSEDELPILDFYHQRAGQNKVPSRIIGREEAAELEPRVACVGALFLPTSGIIDATALVHQIYALASGDGAIFLTGTELTGASCGPEGIALDIAYRDGAADQILTQYVVNCAGLFCDEVAAMMHAASAYQVDPVRSDTVRFYRTKRPELGLVGHNVYPTPQKIVTPSGTYFSVGVHLTPTLEIGPQGEAAIAGTVTVGPLSRPALDKYDYGGEFRPPSDFLNLVGDFFPGLAEDDLEPYQAGIQARLAGCKDWVIEFSPAEPRCLNLMGMDSPGLTGSLAIARHVAAMLDG